ncbi:MAG: 3-hydroxyacyl-CoA dehydrogenase [Deltaproteobacteria bacterium]|nr:3-hydroxyacyl-CoA dehydrogenase [Deltaproteobacteria bacterium]MBW1924815.1 3-hydroxyacyl-CoA dehydrogenase [Deltaproteobacteria bacterium]MBW1950778.1 3-hydroxyacyl-CoA dehydrogenase [Deltaproteobacteria bacterium]MBW2009088.1 3-hydroxyacyl-CoA dehydrogenase [Deltaproteobacteria bacterium]MBW2103549.1 3-hydroxyacyl-CoA dehydrogenase [Deltaproteobacteria bacterium]
MEIRDRVFVVTGGASGLGEATVKAFAARGGKAVILDLAEERGRMVADDLGDSAIFCRTDVTDEASVSAALDAAIEAFGAVHVAVNCAGVATPAKVIGKEGPIELSVFEKVVRINLVGTLNVTRLAALKMLENAPAEDGEKGVVINTASAAAYEGQIGQAAYAASKAGVVGMTLPVAREFAEYGIRVVTIAPGLFDTPMMAGLPEKARESLNKMVPFPKRMGKPEEFAALAVHIVENAMINGAVLRLDGAIRMAAR